MAAADRLRPPEGIGPGCTVLVGIDPGVGVDMPQPVGRSRLSRTPAAVDIPRLVVVGNSSCVTIWDRIKFSEKNGFNPAYHYVVKYHTNNKIVQA